jgi:hypothetical protein
MQEAYLCPETEIPAVYDAISAPRHFIDADPPWVKLIQ